MSKLIMVDGSAIK
jgi:small GTP-binding protein